MFDATQNRTRRAKLTFAIAFAIFVTSLPLHADSAIAALRRATASFHQIETAMAAGWTDEITGCMESPAGGMGYHYANFELLQDAEVDPLRPEAVMYEPQKNGTLRLVAVEYVIPEPFLPRTAPAPVVLGESMHFAEAVSAWVLHVWLWKHNPDGMFADWNPRVSCQYAP